MLRFDFNTYMKKYISKSDISTLEKEKDEIIKKLSQNPMNGWLDTFISSKEVEDIIRTGKKIRRNSDCFVVVGIGGSFLGSYAVCEMFSKYFGKKYGCEVLYAGCNISKEYMEELLDYLKYKDFTINVISKSGSTMETLLAYKKLLKLLKEKYSKEEVRKRIIITTDKHKGLLRDDAEKNNYKSFRIPDDIGGRYSIFTPANLLAISVLEIDIEALLRGAKNGSIYLEDAYYYASVRKLLFDKGKRIENFSVYEPKMYYFTEWLKQLFGESEGKNNKGIFPVSTVNTRDLHSLGQFLQEGTPIVFETVIKVENSSVLTNKVIDSVSRAHYNGNTPCNIIMMDSIKPYTIGEVMYFFMLSAAFSSYLMGVNPFDQPGVEAYKKEIRESLK